MANSNDNLALVPIGKGARPVTLPVDGGTHVYAGTMVAQLNATSMLVNVNTALSGPVIGVATHEQDATAAADSDKRCAILYDGIFEFDNAAAPHACSEAVAFGTPIYAQDDNTLAADSNVGAYAQAGVFAGMSAEGRVRVYIPFRRADTDPLESDLSTTAGAGLVGILDAGGFTAAATVEAALAELYQDAETTKAIVRIPLAGAILAAGTPLAAFADNAASAPGLTLQDAKAVGVRWNDNAAQAAVWTDVVLPQDLDPTHPMVFKVLASKSGATIGDATKFTIACFAQTVAALHDAGADLGGDTSAMTGNAAAKTVQEVSLSVAVPPTPPAVCSVSIKPKDGTLGTDDVTVEGFWLEYHRKLFTA